jgi:hypothetical protein
MTLCLLRTSAAGLSLDHFIRRPGSYGGIVKAEGVGG